MFHVTGVEPLQPKSKKKKQKRKYDRSLKIRNTLWLQENGLDALKLTISDVLAPSVLQLTTEGINNNTPKTSESLQLLILSAVNLPDYDEKLRSTLIQYENRLDRIVWSNLSKEERERFGSTQSISYLSNIDNTCSILEAFDRLGWPVELKELNALVKEIDRGEGYLRQSAEIQKAARKLSAKPRKQKDNKVVHQHNYIARDETDGFYYSAKIKKQIDDKTYLVSYKHGGTTVVPTKYVLPKESDDSYKRLRVEDHVLAQQDSRKVFVPAVIVGVPGKYQKKQNYNVVYYDGIKADLSRKKLVKISQMHHYFALDFIKNLPDSNKTKQTSTYHKTSPGKPDHIDELCGAIQLFQTTLDNTAEEHQAHNQLLHEHSVNLEKVKLDIDDLTRQQNELKSNKTKPVIELDKSTNTVKLEHKATNTINEVEAKKPVDIGDEVLVRSLDDGWYYRGIIVKIHNDVYSVENDTGYIEKTKLEDIIPISKSPEPAQIKDYVIALHPRYPYTYAPAIVQNIRPDEWTQVCFYDRIKANVPQDEVYRVSKHKFEKNVIHIVDCEKRWVGQSVVARSDVNGEFNLASCTKRVGNGHQFNVQWSDGSTSVQDLFFIMGKFTKWRQIKIGDHVIAMTNPTEVTFLPGLVTGTNGNLLIVEFCNGSISHHADADKSFWISETYFGLALAYYRSKL